jgi:hypothetical protein
MSNLQFGILASEAGYTGLPIVVCRSQRGFYLGTVSDQGPVSRESKEYFDDESSAREALEQGTWTQRKYA